MKIHSTPRNWKWLSEYSIENSATHQIDLKNNPDVQYDTALQGYWIRPNSKIHVLMILNGTYDTIANTWHTNINALDWRDHD
jgi:hypothetical protein